MAKLSIQDIIAKKEDCKNRKKIKKCLIHSEFLGGELEAHSLSKEDLADVRVRLRDEGEEGVYHFIFLSIDELRDPELKKAFSCKRGIDIVDRLFSDAEKAMIVDILSELNGLTSLDENAILKMEIEDLKN
nr:MAG TPA: tail assembly chaperone protein [Caudoviricetes sp.]